MIWQYLETRGWLNFSIATPTISTFFDEVGAGVEAGSEADLVATDLIHLTAAELSLPDGLGNTPPYAAPFHLEISQRAAQLALYSSDCGPFKTHNPREQPKLWDVPLLGSDASKLAWIAGTDQVDKIAEQFVATVSQLANMHTELSQRRQPSSDDPTAWRPEVFAVRATLWRAKIAVLLGDDETSDTLQETLQEVHSALRGEAIA